MYLSANMIRQAIDARYIDFKRLTQLLKLLFGGTFTVKVGRAVKFVPALNLGNLMPYVVQR